MLCWPCCRSPEPPSSLPRTLHLLGSSADQAERDAALPQHGRLPEAARAKHLRRGKARRAAAAVRCACLGGAGRRWLPDRHFGALRCVCKGRCARAAAGFLWLAVQVRGAYVDKVGAKMLDLFRTYWAAMERLEASGQGGVDKQCRVGLVAQQCQ